MKRRSVVFSVCLTSQFISVGGGGANLGIITIY